MEIGWSDIADAHGLGERGRRVARRPIFVRDEAGEARHGDGAHDGGIEQFLRVVNFVAAGHACRVEVGNIFDVLADGGDDVALLCLHVEDVIEELEALGADAPAQLDTPRGVVALIVLVHPLAVEQLHAERDLFLLGVAGELL